MLLPLNTFLKRGVVFLYPRFPHLSDPALAGQTKPKYLIILSSSPNDDPILYALTTSEKPKHASSPLKDDFLLIVGGKYPFLPIGTIINVGTAGDFSFDREDLEALYQSGELIYQGVLDVADITMMITMIQASRRVANRTKQILQP